MNIFKKNTEELSAKDYIEKKRNKTLYYDCTDTGYNNDKGKRIAWNSNKNNRISNITSFNNHSNRIKVTKGYYDYFQSCKNDPAFFTKHVDIETFKSDKASECRIPDNGNTVFVNVQGELIARPEMLSNDPYFNFERNYTKIGTENNSGDENKVSSLNIKCMDLGKSIPIYLADYWLKNEKNSMLSSVTYPFTKDTPEEEIGHTVEDFAVTSGTYYLLPLHINNVEQEDITVKVVIQKKRVKEISIDKTNKGPNTWDCHVRYGDLVKIDLTGENDHKKTIILKLNFDALTSDKTDRACY